MLVRYWLVELASRCAFVGLGRFFASRGITCHIQSRDFDPCLSTISTQALLEERLVLYDGALRPAVAKPHHIKLSAKQRMS